MLSDSYSESAPNPAAPGNGAMASLFDIERLGRAVPEPQRWAPKQPGIRGVSPL